MGKKHGEPFLQGMVDPGQFPTWMSDDEIDYLVKEFEGSGFRGPLNRYRNFHRDFAAASRHAGKKITQPALFMAGDRDVGIRMFAQCGAAHARAFRGPARLPSHRRCGTLEPAREAVRDEPAAAGLAQRFVRRSTRERRQ